MPNAAFAFAFSRLFPIASVWHSLSRVARNAAGHLEFAVARAVESDCISGFIEGCSFRAAYGAGGYQWSFTRVARQRSLQAPATVAVHATSCGGTHDLSVRLLPAENL